MASIMIERQVSLEEAADALRRQLGDSYKVRPRAGAREAIGVTHGAAMATVHIDHSDGVTVFRVHGGGLILGRLVNELGFARRISTTLKDTLEHGTD